MARLKVLVSLCLIVSLGFMLLQGVLADNLNNIQVAYATATNQDSDNHSSVSDDVYRSTTPYIVGLKKGVDVDHFLDKKGLKNKKDNKTKKFKSTNSLTIHLDQNELQSLQDDTEVLFVEVDALVEIASQGKFKDDHPSNQFRNKDDQTTPWGIHAIGADIAHANNYKGQSINIAVLDTGIADHPDLKVFGGISFVDGVTSYSDDHGHGTHVAGTIAASDNKFGVIGGAPKSKVLAVKVLDSSGQGSYSQVIQGIEWAIDQKADIISISFGGIEYSRALHEAIQLANDNGILVIAAAGNNGGSGEGTELYPALFTEVVSVGAVTQSHQIASYSSRGSKIDLVAPGSGVLSTTNNQDYNVLSGTSMAAPHVTSAAALLWAKNKSLTHQEVKNLLFATATPLGDSKDYGHGLVNVAKGLGLIEHAIEPLVIGELEDDQSPIGDPSQGDVSIAAYDLKGNHQTINAGQSATVSLKIDEPKASVYIGVFNPAGDKIANALRSNVSAGVDVSFTWYSSSSTPAGTYKIKYAYSNTDDRYSNYFTIYVNSPNQPPPSPPSAPTGLSASSITTNSIQLYWSSVSGASGYQIRRNGQLLGTTTSTSYNFTGLSSSTQYKLEVAAYNSNGTSSYSYRYESTLTPPPTPLPTPQNFRMTSNTHEEITMSWSAVSGATSYTFMIDGVALPSSQRTTATSYTFKNLSSERSYILGVRAENNQTNSTYAIKTEATRPKPIPPVPSIIIHAQSYPLVEKKNIPIQVNSNIPSSFELYVKRKGASDNTYLLVDTSNNYINTPEDVYRTSINLKYTPTSSGEYTLKVKAVSEAKAEGTTTSHINVDYVRHVVVYVPGILGTEIKGTFGSVWRLWPTVLPSDVKRLFLNDNGLPEQNSNGDYLTTPGNVFESFLFGDFKVDQTEKFLTSLRKAGIQVVKAPYDWRLDLGEAKSAVDAAINDAVEEAHGQDITLISHSAGGLVARNYLIDNPNAKVKNFINIASPTLGAPRAMKGLIVGDDLGVSEEYFGIKFPIDDETGKSLAQNMTSIYQFLPGKRFVDIYNKIYSSNNSVTYRTFYKDSSQYIENYIDTERYISDNHNAPLYTIAKSFRQKIETTPISNRFEEHRIVGFGQPTIIRVDKTYIKENPHDSNSRVLEKFKLHTGTGDTVVPVRSADFNLSGNAKIHYIQRGHVRLLEDTDTQTITKQIVFGLGTKAYPLTESLSGFRVDANCPVHIYVVDQHGNTAGLNEEGILENNIPDLSYEIWGETKSLFIPTDLNVQISIDGYDTGFMDIAFTKYEADFPVKTNVLHKINIEPNTKLEFDLAGSTNEASTIEIQYDLKGNGVTQTLSPEIELTPEEYNDITPPTTTTSIQGQKQNDWYSSDVAIQLHATDDGGSGVTQTYYRVNDGEVQEYNEPIILTTDGIYEVDYYSSDKAGNYEFINRTQIKIDQTQPEISVRSTPEPNEEGWNNTDVEIKYSAADAKSGIDILTPTQLISSEGANQLFFGEAVDLAGNKSTISISLSIDKSAPQTMIDVKGEAGQNNWFVGDVEVSLQAEDALSGVSRTEYSFDQGKTWKKYDIPLQLTEEKVYSFSYRSIDVADNVEETKEETIRIDKTAPVSTILMNGELGKNNWYVGPVTVSINAQDSVSQVSNTYYQVNDGELVEGTSILLAEEGKYKISYYSVDLAGNKEISKEQLILIDQTKPEITVERLPDPNQKGWNNTNVELKYTAMDALSGLDYVTPDHVVSIEGETQVYIGEALDVAGNKNTTSITLNIDKTAPQTLIEVAGLQGENNWYVGEVTLTLTAIDNLSGVDFTEYSFDGGTTWDIYSDPIVLRKDHIYSLLYRSVDHAGNVEESSEYKIKLDQTKPELVYTQLEAEYYWNDEVTIHFSATDSLSGVQFVEAKLNGKTIKSGIPIQLLELGMNTLVIKSKDEAGNETVVSQTFEVLIKATITVNPSVIVLPKGKINPNSNAVINVFIELPHEFDVSQISTDSVTLNDVVGAKPSHIKINKAQNRLHVQFNRGEVQAILEKGEQVEIKIDANYKTELMHIRGFDYINVK